MDYPTMGVCIAGAGVIAPFVYRLLPQREAKGVLKDHDLDRLDSRVKLYDRLLTVENSQTHHGEIMSGLQRDNSLIFSKLDDLKDLIIRNKE
jgi:hypothetical protein